MYIFLFEKKTGVVSIIYEQPSYVCFKNLSLVVEKITMMQFNEMWV